MEVDTTLPQHNAVAGPSSPPRLAARSPSPPRLEKESIVPTSADSTEKPSTEELQRGDEEGQDAMKDDDPRKSSTPPAADAKAPEVEIPSEADIEAMAAKKRKLAVVADESKKRSKRMFGLLQSTLKQAKDDTNSMSGAAKKRHELEERLASKLSLEKKLMQEKQERDKTTKELKLTVVKKEEEINITQSIYSTRHAAKLKLAEFLCTSFTPPPPTPTAADGIRPSFIPKLPHSIRLTNPRAARPIYYRPKRLLYFQEDQIEDQVAAVKKAIRKEKEDWEDAKGTKIDDLELAKRKRDEGLEDIERKDREDRQRRRREKEELEDKAAAARNETRKGSPGKETGDDVTKATSAAMEVDSNTASQNGKKEEKEAVRGTPPRLDPAVKGMEEAKSSANDVAMADVHGDEKDKKAPVMNIKNAATAEGEEDLEY